MTTKAGEVVSVRTNARFVSLVGVEAIDVQWMAAIKDWVHQPYLHNGRATTRCLPSAST